MDISAFKGIYAGKPTYDFQHLQNLHRREVVAQIAADIQTGKLVKETRDCLYIYEFTDGHRSTISMIALMNSNMFASQRIKAHERTFTEQEISQARLFEEFRLQINPVMLIFNDKIEIGNLLQTQKESVPIVDFKTRGAQHRLWKVCDAEKIKEIINLYHRVSSYYLADGHHRVAAINRSNGSHFMAVLVAAHGIRLHSFHKLFHLGTHVVKNELINKIRNRFSVRKLTKPPSSTCTDVVLLLNKECYKIKPYRAIEPFAVQQYLMTHVLSDGRAEVVTPAQGIPYLRQAVADSDRVIGIYQPKVRLEQVLNMADNGLFVPPKSTYFEPKLPDGLISCDL